MPESICDLGSSIRNGHIFTLTYDDGKKVDVDISTGLAVCGIAPKCAKIHREIYLSQNCTMIDHLTNPYVVAVSCLGETMYPMIDDFAQIVGVDVKTCPWIDGETDECAKDIADKISGRNAVLIEGNGALVTGNNDGDMQALEIIMEKGCEAAVDVDVFNRPHYVPKAECFLMRTVYLAKYSKQINK